MKIYNKETMIAEKIANKDTRRIAAFQGSMNENIRMSNAELFAGTESLIQMATPKWVDSPEYNKLWNQIKTLKEKVVNQNSVPSNLAGLIQLLFVDVTRRVMEIPDLTSVVNIETTNFDYPESVTLREIYKYRGVMEPMALENDSVPLIEQYSGATDHADMIGYGIGWKDTLKNLLYNSLFDMQKVLQAVAEAYVDRRNDLIFGNIFSVAFHTSQRVHRVNTAAPFDTDLYDTLRNAYVTIKQLLDPQNGKIISIPSLALLCHPSRRWEMERVIRGYLETGGANNGTGQIRSALPIDEIVEYAGDSYTWGKNSIVYAGCPVNKAYLFVPRMYSYTLVKRPLTMEVGRGSVLQLSTEERAWYMVQTQYGRDLMGSSWPGTSLPGGYGAIVEISLEPEPVET